MWGEEKGGKKDLIIGHALMKKTMMGGLVAQSVNVHVNQSAVVALHWNGCSPFSLRRLTPLPPSPPS